jgi:hypothetical protein
MMPRRLMALAMLRVVGCSDLATVLLATVLLATVTEATLMADPNSQNRPLHHRLGVAMEYHV